ncbi:MAG: hypothetical protein ED559_12570 [Phycisphaera sp.]|nr:MAG: hypothetical protein ED559_12570 [Phycisphaera sp.]
MRNKLLVTAAALTAICTGCSHHRETGTTTLSVGESRAWIVNGLDVRLEAENLGPGGLRVVVGEMSQTNLVEGDTHRVTLNKAESAAPITVRLTAPEGETTASWVFTGPKGWVLTEKID